MSKQFAVLRDDADVEVGHQDDDAFVSMGAADADVVQLSPLNARDLRRIERSLNDRPRKTLGFMKPSEKLAELLALTA